MNPLVVGQFHFIFSSSVKAVHFSLSNWDKVDEFAGRAYRVRLKHLGNGDVPNIVYSEGGACTQRLFRVLNQVMSHG